MKSKANNTKINPTYIKRKRIYNPTDEENLEIKNQSRKHVYKEQNLTHLNDYLINVTVEPALVNTNPRKITSGLPGKNPDEINYTVNELLKIIRQKTDEILYLNKTLSEVNTRSATLLVSRELQVSELKEINRELRYEILAMNQVEEALKKSNETKDRFFSIIAHDLRNPITAIVGLLSLIKEEADSFSKEEIIELVRDLHSNAENTQNLLENLLDWSKSQTGRLQVVPEICKLYPLIDETIVACENHATLKSISIQTDVDKNIMIRADKNMISTVIRNLLSNAIKFSNYGGNISIFSTEDNGLVKLSIRDRGIGISLNNLKKLFKLENKISSLGTANEKGSGLGLILCKEFVEKNGGELSVESIPGEGSTFSFTMQSAIII
jgi:signal transduction histidine kinase